MDAESGGRGNGVVQNGQRKALLGLVQHSFISSRRLNNLVYFFLHLILQQIC